MRNFRDTLNLSLYIGKGVYEIPEYPDSSDLPEFEHVVIFFSPKFDPAEKTCYCRQLVYVNTSEILQRYDTVTGTVHTNRGIPPNLISKALDKRSSMFVRNKNMLLVRFADKKGFLCSNKMCLKKRTKENVCMCTRVFA